MPLLPSQVVNKRYRIINLLGEGPYGAVYRAWDTKDLRDVALKEYLDTSVEIQRLFRQEASRLEKIKHPQLPSIRDHFSLESQGQYLVSDYIDGVDLQSLLEQYGPLPSELIIGWLQAVSIPLKYLHDQDRLHLNIKPANIRLAPTDEVFLVDSGLPGLGVSSGTSGYASPEQQNSSEVTTASDIYSLGATLYNLLITQVPPNALHRESGLEDLIPAREVNPDIEPYLSLVANRAMDLRPDVRYQTADEFSQALERPIGRPPEALDMPRRTSPKYPPGVPPRVPQSRRRQIERRTIFGLAGVLILIIGIFVGVVLTSRTPSAQEAQVEATATIRSQIIAALTAITTVTPSPVPSSTPIPTPEPLVDERTQARMIYMPGGIFRMGADDTNPDEAPSHLIRLDSYFIDETEVTNGQYRICVQDGECAPPSRPGATYHPAYFGDPGFDNFPVIFVNWFDARDFCAWRGARLPTEAEWERAAGFDPTMAIKYTYPWGDEFDGTLLNFCDVNCPLDDRNTDFDDEHRDTAPVASYPEGASIVGLFDVSGNVMEWVNDWYDPRFYAGSTDTNPLGPLEGEFKTVRGGSWLSSEDEVRVSGRGSYDPSVSRAHLGFRCAMTAP